ncbi:MAG: DUF222 domain-containing protein [Austwickia sp.]|jgi:hypothetical protein|nr:MAG: DUF222 domain-containing protein [Austwickia sp.]
MTAVLDRASAEGLLGWEDVTAYGMAGVAREAVAAATLALGAFTAGADPTDPTRGTTAVGVPSGDLSALCGELLRLRALAEGAAVAVALEAVERGIVAESVCTDLAGWVREQAWQAGIGVPPSLAAAIKTVAEQARRTKPTDLRPLAAAVVAGKVPVSSAKVLGRELDLLARYIPDDVWQTAAAELIDWAAEGAAPGELRAARQRIAATYGTDAFEDEQAAAKRHRELSGWVADDAGGWTCRLRTDNEGRAILDAAFDALAGPSAEVAATVANRPVTDGASLAQAVAFASSHDDDRLIDPLTAQARAAFAAAGGLGSSGSARPGDAEAARAAAYADVRAALVAAGWIRDECAHQDDREHASADDTSCGPQGDDELDKVTALGRDDRTAGQRRHDALIEMARVLATNGAALADVRPTSAVKAQVTITMDYDRLRAGLGPGADGHGTPLTAATVRRMCCDAALIPAVLGGDGAILDWGRARRLASPDQVRYLRQRDKGCSFPGCTRPPAWTEAHHLDEWLLDGGQTNVDRLALLCCRHHDIVHAHRLRGELVDGRVRWRPRSGTGA